MHLFHAKFWALAEFFGLMSVCWANGYIGQSYRVLTVGSPGTNYQNTVSDAVEIQKALTSGANIPAANTTLLASPANLAAVDTAIGATLNASGANDVSLFYFSGHGTQIRVGTTRQGLIVVNEPAYLSMTPAPVTSYMTGETLKESLDSVKGVVVVVLDGCDSGGVNPQRANTIFIASAHMNEAANAEDNSLRHYVFTYYLIRALTVDRGNNGFLTADKNTDRQVTVQEWFDYASSATKDFIKTENGIVRATDPQATLFSDQNPVLDDSQLPNGKKAGDVVIFQYTPGVAIAIDPEAATVAASGSQWFKAKVSGDPVQTVLWALNPPNVGTLGIPVVKPDGVWIKYAAPAAFNAGQKVTVAATSVRDPTKSAQATITLQANGAGLQAVFTNSNGDQPPAPLPPKVTTCAVVINPLLQLTPPVKVCRAVNNVFYLSTECGVNNGVNFTNVSATLPAGPKVIQVPYLEVVTLQGPGCPCKIQETGGGLGSLIYPALLGQLYDNTLDPGEWFNIKIGVVVTNLQPFSFWVDTWGYVATLPGPIIV